MLYDKILLRLLFALLYFLIALIRLFLTPLLILFLKKRWTFERKNHTDPYFDRSPTREAAAYFFEVSSEGELEQVKPLIYSALKKNQIIEICYCSPSVEVKINRLAEEYQGLVRLLRLPLLDGHIVTGISLRQFITAPKVILCRYDFFPEILSLGFAKRLYLASASLKSKKESLNNPIYRLYAYWLYAHFEVIFAASDSDKLLFEALKLPGKLFSYDFRHVQIIDRVNNAKNVLESVLPLKPLMNFLGEFEKSNRFIMGSAWPIEMEIFSSLEFQTKIVQRELLVVIAPHQLSEIKLTDLVEALGVHAPRVPLYILKRNFTIAEVEGILEGCRKTPGIIISLIPGILCEFYTQFAHAFVGGGHGRSIHSLLEPYWAGCRLYCGPKVHRSTEYDYVLSASHENIDIIINLSEFHMTLFKHLAAPLDLEKRVILANLERLKLEMMQGEVLA